MPINMILLCRFILSVIFIVNIVLVKFVAPTPIISTIRYCDGNKLMKLTSDQCSGGINFGEKKPDCVCISGIYRFWMDTCLLHEGYSFNGCSTLLSYDGDHQNDSSPQVADLVPPYERESVSQVIGLQFALGSANLIEDYSTEILAVFSENDTDYEPMKVFRVNETTSTSATKIYYTNAEVHIMVFKNNPKQAPFFCVGKNKNEPAGRLCLTDRKTLDGWLAKFNPVKLEVRSTHCKDDMPGDMYALKVIPDWCFELITKEKSECSLSCDPTEGKFNNRTNSIPDGNSNNSIDSSPEGKSNSSTNSAPKGSGETDASIEDGTGGDGTSPVGNSTKPAQQGTSGESTKVGDSGEDVDKKTMRPPTVVTPYENSLKDCKEPTIGEIKNQHNSFLNRKLNHWSKLRQVGQLEKPMLSQIKPTRSFRILDIVKQIAQKTCPNKFVSPIFFDQAIDLFVILHKGREYRFTEDLEHKDALWIERILHKCNMDIHHIRLYAEDSGDTGCNDFEKAEGYCRTGSLETNDCERMPLNISHEHSEFKHHFVVDVAWNLIDLIQITCFDHFAESYRMFHAWEQSAEKLFTREIRKLWVQPKLDKKVYQNLLTPTAIYDMYNLEMCIEAAYDINPALTRLLRPPEPKRFFRRKKREADSDDADRIGSNKYDVFCRKKSDDFYTPC